MTKLVAEFKTLPLSQQHETFPLLIAAYNAAKEARRAELETEIKQLGFRPGEAKKSQAAVKYRSKVNPALGWGGRGAVATWLKDEMAVSGLPLEAFRVT